MTEPLQRVVADNKLPIIVSFVALAVAIYVGLIPVWQNNQREAAQAPAPTGTVALVDLAALNDRVAALEAAAAEAAEAPAPPPVQAEPAGIDPELRAELDLIVKGLVNQTGRVSRLKKDVAVLQEASGQVPSIVTDEISLAKRGLSNLTRRVNALNDTVEPLDPTLATVDRLTLQMTNVERAVTQLNRKLNALRSQPASATEAPTQDLGEISVQLEAILTKLSKLQP